MARANLNISADVQDAFLLAQEEDSKVRGLKITISNEDLVLGGTIGRTGTAADDFNSVPGFLGEKEACLVVFCLSDALDAGKGKSWLLLAWVPDGCRVRDKMLYSSSREDLKRSLGLGHFTEEFSANLISDVTWESFLAYTKKGDNHSILTEKEKLIIEENALSHEESTKSKSTAMGVLPFTLSAEVKSEFQSFLSCACNWLELSVVSEVINLVSSKALDKADNLAAHITADSARFIILRFANHLEQPINFFIFSCPEDVPIRMKMTMSSSKATVIAAAVDNGIQIDRTLEIRGADEITDLLKAELDAPTADSSSSASATISHAKPQRPGCGRARVAKFQADPDP